MYEKMSNDFIRRISRTTPSMGIGSKELRAKTSMWDIKDIFAPYFSQNPLVYEQDIPKVKRIGLKSDNGIDYIVCHFVMQTTEAMIWREKYP